MGKTRPDPRRQPLRSFLVAPLLAYARDAGADARALAARFDVGLESESVVLPIARLDELFEACAEALRDPFLGVHLGEALQRGTFGLVELSVESAPTVADALARLTRYHALLNDVVSVTLHERDDLLIVEQCIAGAPLCIGRHPNEAFVVNVLLRARRASARALIPEHAFFAHPRPPSVAELERVLGTSDLRFGTGKNGLALARGDATAALVTADAPLARVLADQAERLLESQPRSPRLVDRARAWISGRLRGAPPTLAELASALRLPPRTLQRHLAEEQTSLAALVDALREERAREWVARGGQSTDELAYELGYADSRAFLRAFKRWTATTPRRFRA